MHQNLQLSPLSGAAPPTRDLRFTGRLVLRAVRSTTPPSFVLRRAQEAVRALDDPTERRLLGRVLLCGGAPSKARAIVCWSAHLEASGRIGEAAAALDVALKLVDDEASIALHAARVARKADDRARAAAFYDRVQHLDVGYGTLSRLADVGRAIISADAISELTRALRAARRAHDPETAAVAHEARAIERRRTGDVDGALRDYLFAAARFEDPLDVGRVGHEAADLLLSVGDVATARLVLTEIESRAQERQVLWARARLLVLARATGDVVGEQRWRDTPTPPLTSLMRTRTGDDAPARHDRLLRAIRRVDAIRARST